MKTLTLFAVLVLGLTFTACDKPAAEDPAPPPAEAAAPEPAEKEVAEEPAAKPEPAVKIEVAAAGAKFDPPVQPEQLPEGAWYCDMGTVHWAATEKPEDGKCPVCGMALKQYASADHAAQKANAIEPGADEHGHEHGKQDEHDDHGHEH